MWILHANGYRDQQLPGYPKPPYVPAKDLPFVPAFRMRVLIRLLLLLLIVPAASAQPQFRKHVLDSRFVSEGIAVADVNRDGRPDVLAGSFWFEAPAWKAHEIRPPQIYPGGLEDLSDSFLNFALDVNRDGWVDFIRVDFPNKPAIWYENPKGGSGHWRTHVFHAAVANETPLEIDADRDGQADLLFSAGAKQLVWYRGSRTAGDTTWAAFPVGGTKMPGSEQFGHGLGFGDVNGDSRPDVLVRQGWYEAPADPAQAAWAFHPVDFVPDCAQMYAFDFDGDGDADIVASSAHSYGIWWVEQRPGGTWERHLIHDKTSETHALALADMNADGRPDLVTGKRVFPHADKDPGALEPALLYWFELGRSAEGRPAWTPHLIDSDSGVGLQVLTTDVTGDGRPDIVTANKKGIFVFENLPQ